VQEMGPTGERAQRGRDMEGIARCDQSANEEGTGQPHGRERGAVRNPKGVTHNLFAG
jgi:hypothetical protein